MAGVLQSLGASIFHVVILLFFNVFDLISRESCIAVRDLFCKVEWRMLKNTNNRSMPECDNLPSKYNSSTKCVYVDLFNVTKDQITSES